MIDDLRFENTIVNQFYGHTHNDEFKVFYDSTGSRATSFGFVTPSVTPYTDVNLSYRIYTVDGDYTETTRVKKQQLNYNLKHFFYKITISFFQRVIDYDTFIGDLSTAGSDASSPMEYRLLYNAK